MERKRVAKSVWGGGAVCASALLCAGLAMASSADSAAAQSAASPTRTTAVRKHKKPPSASARSGSRTAARKPRGQQKIDPERALAIQQALIRERYLSGGIAAGWNQQSEDAMRRYQADHGWQSKTVPDSRALISLGLGPSHDRLLNPESAMTTGPAMSNTASAAASPPIPSSRSVDPRRGMSDAPALPGVATPAMSSDRDSPRQQ